MDLYIGNQKYSSWSFRPWIAMKVKGVEFTEVLRRFDDHPERIDFKTFSPTGKVPMLDNDGVKVWESLAILEYLADLFPDRGFWPQNVERRAHARAISAEMLGGFGALRSECPMNMARRAGAIDVSDDVRRDVARIEEIWRECLEVSGGPFLFGEFCNADAMYAPVVNRLEIYELSQAACVTNYSATMKSLPAWQQWQAAGKAEPWIYPEDEA